MGDSAATSHVADPEVIPDFNTYVSNFEAADFMVEAVGGFVRCTGTATMHYSILDVDGAPVKLTLRRVLIIPGGRKLLMSVGCLEEAGGGICINIPGMANHLRLPGLPVRKIPVRRAGKVYPLEVHGDAEAAALARGSSVPEQVLAVGTLFQWHFRMGHVHEAGVKQLAAMEGTGVELQEGGPPLEDCETCRLGKARNPSDHPLATQPNHNGLGSVFHTDTIMFPDTAIGGWQGARVFVEQESRLAVVYPVKHKADLEQQFNQLRSDVCIPWRRHPYHLHGDSAGENLAFTEAAARTGTIFTRSPPYTKESNGLCERAIGTIKRIATCLLVQSGLPSNLWWHALLHAVWLYNRRPHRALGGDTPFFRWTGKVPKLDDLVAFGSLAYVLDEQPTGTLPAKSWRGHWLGFAANATGEKSAYIFCDKKVVVSIKYTIIEHVGGPLVGDGGGGAGGTCRRHTLGPVVHLARRAAGAAAAPGGAPGGHSRAGERGDAAANGACWRRGGRHCGATHARRGHGVTAGAAVGARRGA
jgi:hypothetical protein